MPHQPTRLPYGLSYVKPGVGSTAYTFTAGDTTPDVSYGTYFIVGASALTITNFDGGELGKVIHVYSNTGGAVVIQNSAGGIRIPSLVLTGSGVSGVLFTTAGNVTMLNGETLSFLHNGTDWSALANRVSLNTQV
jgi:hypothetical protein